MNNLVFVVQIRIHVEEISGGCSTEAAQRRGKYPPQATDTEVNNCFSIY